MNTNTIRTSTGVSAWAPVGVSPIAQRQGSGLPFAAEYQLTAPVMGLATDASAHTGDAKVPDPRGRKR